jgi:glycogen synthase
MKREILIISPEVFPQIKVGGLGKMVAGITKGLGENGTQVKVISPKHQVYSPLWQKKTRLNYHCLGNRAANWVRSQNWQPDWLWVQDWGGVWAAESFFKKSRVKPKVVWTIHSPVGDNYGYEYGYEGQMEDDKPIDWGDSFFNFAGLIRKGIRISDLVTTVSESYARKLRCHQLFVEVKPVTGINNGIDDDEWNPYKDRLVGYQLKKSWLEFKAKNKQILQEKFGLPARPVPVFAFVSRIVPQKGLELLLKILPKFVGRNDLQFIFVGDGKKKLLEEIKKLRDHFAKKIAARLKADFEFPHQVFAGADFLVLPSVAEPFGMVVAEAKKYGVVPIVHLVDGLKDQVKDGQNGFGFQKYQVNQLEEKLYQALRVWQREWQLKRLGDWTRLEDWFTVSRKWLEVLYG